MAGLNEEIPPHLIEPQQPSLFFKLATEAVQLGLIGLLSAPILKAVFPTTSEHIEGAETAPRKSTESAPSIYSQGHSEIGVVETAKREPLATLSTQGEDPKASLLRTFSTKKPEEIGLSSPPTPAETPVASPTHSQQFAVVPIPLHGLTDQSTKLSPTYDSALGEPISSSAASTKEIPSTHTPVPAVEETVAMTEEHHVEPVPAAAVEEVSEAPVAHGEESVTQKLKDEILEHQDPSHVVDPTAIESSGPHGLVYHEGKYVHQRELDGEGSTGVVPEHVAAPAETHVEEHPVEAAAVAEPEAVEAAPAHAAASVKEGTVTEEGVTRPPTIEPSRSYIKSINGAPSFSHKDYAATIPTAASIREVEPEAKEEAAPAAAVAEIAPGYAPSTNGYPQEKDRNMLAEGQAYRADGSVPGKTESTAEGSHGAHAGEMALTGAGIAGLAGAGLAAHHHEQDSTFRNERAMSPETVSPPAQRLAMNDQGIITGMAPGPSPGPAVQPFQPTQPQVRTSGVPPTANGTSPTSPGANGGLARGNTMRSTMSRNSTLRKGGAFRQGAGLVSGGLVEQYGRDDIHERTEIADRELAQAGPAAKPAIAKIAAGEAKDAKKLSKLIQKEAKNEAQAVKAAMKELEALQSIQRDAHRAELKAGAKHAKALVAEHKAKLKFLKQKEIYDKVAAELASREAQYEAKREHSANQTDLLAEKVSELNDLRAQKAADDRERELKLLSLKNPGHA